MRRLLIGLGAAFVLLVIGLLAAPSFVDWNRWKGEIAARLEQATGREVRIDGPLSLALLPAPTLSARGIRVANAPGAAAPDMVTVGALDVRLAFLPLLSGKISVTSVALIDPVIELQRLPDGSVNWDLKRSRAAAAAGEPGGGQPAPPPAATGGRGGEPSVAVDRLTVRNGTLVYRGADGAVERAEKINATARIESLDGPYRAEGDLGYRGASLAFDASVGRLGERAPVRVGLSTGKDAARVELSGDVAIGRQPGFVGKLRAGGNDLAALARLAGAGELPSALGRSFALNGNLNAAASAVELSDIELALDETRAAGSARYAAGTPATLEVKLAAGRLDLDKFAAAETPRAKSGTDATAAPPSQGGSAASASGAAPAAGAAASGGVSLPQNLRASFELAIEAVVWHQSPVRQARLDVTLEGGELRINRLAALFPGTADATLSGTLAVTGGAPNFEGVVEAEADNLRGTLDWLGAPAGGVPADRLRKTSLSARFKATPERIEVNALDASIDASRVTGAATVLLRDRPAVGARLAIDRVTVDAYLPQGQAAGPAKASSGPASTKGAAAPSTGPATATTSSGGGGVLTGFDANLDASVEELIWQGQPLRGLHLVGTLQQGAVALREASLRDAFGTAAKLSGSVADLGGGAPRLDMSFDLRGDEIERPLRALTASFAGRAGGPFSLNGTAKGALDGLAIDATLQALGGRARVTGNTAAAAGGGGGRRFDAELEVDHPSIARLVRFFDPAYRLRGGDAGALHVATKLAGDAQSIALRDLALTAGPATLSASANVTLATPRPAIAADIRIGDIAVDRFLPEGRSASLAPPSLPRASILLAQAGGPARRAGSPTPAPHWSTERLNLSAFSWVDAEIKLSGDSLSYGKWRLDKPQIALGLKNAVLDLNRLAGNLFGGALDAKGQLDAAAAGKPAVKATLGLRQTDLREALADAAGISAVEGRADLELELSGAGGSTAELVGALDGGGKFAAGPGVIHGIDLRAISDRLNDINRLADILDLARGARGETRYRSLQGSFGVANGVASSNDIRLVADGADGEATATVDLPRWQMQSRVSFRLTDHPKAPPLVLLIDGPLDEPHKTVDISALEQFLAVGGLQRLLRPRDSGAPSSDRASPSPPPDRPERVLRDLFQNLVRPPPQR